MRGKCKKKKHPKHGDVRVITKFLLFPKCINGEWRWLEWATFKEVHNHDYVNHEEPCWACWDGLSWVE